MDSKSLNLWKQQLGAVPAAVWENTGLETLILADNGLTELSDGIGALTRLRTLDLGHNQLTTFPSRWVNWPASLTICTCTTTS